MNYHGMFHEGISAAPLSRMRGASYISDYVIEASEKYIYTQALSVNRCKLVTLTGLINVSSID